MRGGLGCACAPAPDVGGGGDDRHGVGRQVFNGIDHAEYLGAAAIVADAARDGAVNDRAGTRLDDEVAGDRAVQDQLDAALQGRALGDEAIDGQVLADRQRPVDILMHRAQFSAPSECVIKDIIIYSEGGESDHCSAFLKFAVGASSGGLMGSAPAGPCDDGARPDAALSKPGHDQLGNSGSALWAEGCESAAFRPDSYERLYHPDLSSVGVVRNSIGPGAPEKRDVAK
jgi:hypothetical protein